MNNDPKNLVYCVIEGVIAFIVLNRPEKMNALNADMVMQFFEIFKKLDEDPLITFIVIKSHGPMFSSGGDIKEIYEHYKNKKLTKIESFFNIEYSLINKIASSKKTISLVEGLAYGAGLAVALACQYPFFLMNTKAAAPEINIAFYPDAGLSYWLNQGDKRFPGFAHYFGMTGKDITPPDLDAAGLISGIIDRKNMSIVEKSLIENQPRNSADLIEIMKFFIRPTVLKEVQDIKNKASDYKDMARITDFNRTTFKTSDLSFWTTFTHIRKTKGKTLRDVLSLDLCLSNTFIHTHDFFEGIRVKLINKGALPSFSESINDSIKNKVKKIYQTIA